MPLLHFILLFFHHLLLTMRVLFLTVFILFLRTVLLVVRQIKAALGFFRAPQRVWVYFEETQELCPGIVIMSYPDGCAVQVEIRRQPYAQRTCFYTHEQLSAWNPKRRRENPPGAAALVVAPIVFSLADYFWSILVIAPSC